MSSATFLSSRVQSLAGPVLGLQLAGVNVYHGIPYAQAPVGEARFAAPRPMQPWKETRACTCPASIPPQMPSRLRTVMGDFGGEQSEDCLSLTVYAPVSESSPRAVMVWLHGGAYMSGGGSLECYSAEVLAKRGDVVVVSPNFRLGALGLLYLPGVSEGNLALLDIEMALRWIQDNVAAFGGDPSRVTLFGQSSGASCIRALMSMPSAEGLFQRAVLQSAALGRPDRTPEYATEIGGRLAHALGIEPADRQGWIEADTSRLLAAQGQVARSFDMPLGASELPFTPVVDGSIVRAEADYNWFADDGPRRALIVGFNAQEMNAWHLMEPSVLNASREEAQSSIGRWLRGDAEATSARMQASEGWRTPAKILGDFYTDALFGAPSKAFAQRMAAHGVRTWTYRFDWTSASPLEACHCLELPFIFHNRSQWGEAPMLGEAKASEFDPLAERMQKAWAAFAHEGDPNHGGLAPWPQLSQAADELMVLV